MLADSAEGNPFIYISNTVFTGVTHSSNLPLLQGAVTGIRVISVGTGHLRLLTQHDDRTQALSGRAGKHTNMQTLNHEITYRWFNQAQRNTFLILSKEGLKPLFTCFSSPPPPFPSTFPPIMIHLLFTFSPAVSWILPAEAVEALPQQDPLSRLQVHVADPTVHRLGVRQHVLAVHHHQTGKILPALRLPCLTQGVLLFEVLKEYSVNHYPSVFVTGTQRDW